MILFQPTFDIINMFAKSSVVQFDSKLRKKELHLVCAKEIEKEREKVRKSEITTTNNLYLHRNGILSEQKLPFGRCHRLCSITLLP